MTAFIIKSSISLLFLFGLYWFLLRKEKLFVFNRFFLIFSLVFSFIIPFVSIPVNLGNNKSGESLISAINSTIPVFDQEQGIVDNAEYKSTNEMVTAPITFNERINFPVLLLILYLAGVIVLLVRFLRNILFISGQIKSSEKIAYSGQRLVLTDNQVNPFCFLNTIFVSKQAFLNNQIAGELLNHELEHVRQAHSADVIFIELIQIVYWFNPIIILYNKAVRVNHEYLADNGVIQDSPDIITYADKLINFVTCNRNVPLTSGFNPSLTRKRLIMLTKSKSGVINYGTRIFITINFAVALFLILSFTPSYPQQSEAVMDAAPFTEPQSLKVRDESTVVSDAGKIQKQPSGENKPAVQETNTGKKLIIVDGVIYNGRLNDIPIDSIEVLEVLSSFQATRKYGDKGKNGVVVIKTKQSAQVSVEKHQFSVEDTMDKALKIVDGVEYLGKIKDIPEQEIQTMSILKDESATAVFGEKGKNGVVVITTTGKNKVPVDQNSANLIITAGDLPDPVALFQNKSSGSVSRSVASKAYVLEAVLKEPIPNIKFEIVSFNMGMRIDSTDIEISSDGNKFTDEMRSMLASLTRGKYLFIKDIKAIGPDNKVRDLSPIVLKID